MRSFRRVSGVTLSARRELGVESLLLHVKRSQLSWFGDLIRILRGAFLWRVFRTHPNTLERLCVSFGLETPAEYFYTVVLLLLLK